jgi:hypothetical protein
MFGEDYQRDICKIYVASGRLFVPLIHGVDGLQQLGAAAFVDITRVNPDEFKSVSSSLLTTMLDLRIFDFLFSRPCMS